MAHLLCGEVVKPEELQFLLEKLHYLSQGAQLVVFAGSLPRDVAESFYAEAIHDLARQLCREGYEAHELQRIAKTLLRADPERAARPIRIVLRTG